MLSCKSWPRGAQILGELRHANRFRRKNQGRLEKKEMISSFVEKSREGAWALTFGVTLAGQAECEQHRCAAVVSKCEKQRQPIRKGGRKEGGAGGSRQLWLADASPNVTSDSVWRRTGRPRQVCPWYCLFTGVFPGDMHSAEMHPAKRLLTAAR